MRACIDTSALLKKYIIEPGSDKLDLILESIVEIVVSPTFLLETHCSIQRRFHDKIITRDQADFIKLEVKQDYQFFTKIYWNDLLEEKAFNILEHHKIKTLDSIQLASAIVAKTDIFITSDHKLFQIAKKEIKEVILI